MCKKVMLVAVSIILGILGMCALGDGNSIVTPAYIEFNDMPGDTMVMTNEEAYITSVVQDLTEMVRTNVTDVVDLSNNVLTVKGTSLDLNITESTNFTTSAKEYSLGYESGKKMAASELATATSAGLMSKADKKTIDNLDNLYVAKTNGAIVGTLSIKDMAGDETGKIAYTNDSFVLIGHLGNKIRFPTAETGEVVLSEKDPTIGLTNATLYVHGKQTNIVVRYANGAVDLGIRRNITSSNPVGEYSVIEGTNNAASSRYAHAEGWATYARADGAHSEGYSTYARGQYSHAEGFESTTLGRSSHASGYRAVSAREGSGLNAAGQHDYAYAWQGDSSGTYYHSHGSGTYNVNPTNGLAGFYIGETNLYTFLSTKLDLTGGTISGDIIANHMTAIVNLKSNYAVEVGVGNNPRSYGFNSISVGSDHLDFPSGVSGTIAVNEQVVMKSANPVVVGFGASSTQSGSVAIGNSAKVNASCDNSIAIGNAAEVSKPSDGAGTGQIAIGSSAKVKGIGSAQIGYSANTLTNNYALRFRDTIIIEDGKIHSTLISNKYDIASDYTNNNFVAFTSDNKLKDSGKTSADFVSKTLDKSNNKTAVTIGTRKDSDFSHYGQYSVAMGGQIDARSDYILAQGDHSKIASGANYSVALGKYPSVAQSHKHAFVWQGVDTQTYYDSKGAGTFNINPAGGLSGFYIGDTNLYTILTNKVDNSKLSEYMPLQGDSIKDGNLSVIGTVNISQGQLIVPDTGGVVLGTIGTDQSDIYNVGIRTFGHNAPLLFPNYNDFDYFGRLQDIADNFDDSRTSANKYVEDEMTAYNGKLYRCTNASGHFGAWDSSNFTTTTVDRVMSTKVSNKSLAGVTFDATNPVDFTNAVWRIVELLGGTVINM